MTEAALVISLWAEAIDDDSKDADKLADSIERILEATTLGGTLEEAYEPVRLAKMVE